MAIVGARHPGQVDSWLPAASPQLTQDDLGEIASAIERTDRRRRRTGARKAAAARQSCQGRPIL
jgi:hypothetical protein